MKKVSFNNIISVKYYSVNEKKKTFLEKYLLIIIISLISLLLVYQNL